MPFTKTGKVQVQRMVSRNGKTFTQMFWVNPSDVKATDKVLTPATPVESEDTIPVSIEDLQNTRKTMGMQYALDIAKMAGITWAHSDNPSINWMRCMMAVKKASGVATSKRSSKQLETPTLTTSIFPELAKEVDDAPSGKAKVSLLVTSMGRGGVIKWAKSTGITWKEADNAGVNWMRCSMAVQKYLADHYLSGEQPEQPQTVNSSKVYTVPETSCHIPDNSLFDRYYQEFLDGTTSESQAKQKMLSVLQNMGARPDYLLGDWNSPNIPVISICNIGRAYTAMKTEFPELMDCTLYVENPRETLNKGMKSYLASPAGAGAVAYVIQGSIGIYGKKYDSMPGSTITPNSVVFNADADRAITRDTDLNQSHVVYDASHEFTHHLQLHMVKAILSAGDVWEMGNDTHVIADTPNNIEKFYDEVNTLILKNAVKYLPPEQQKIANRKRSGKGLAAAFSPTVYGLTDAGECIAECMAFHMTGMKYSEKKYYSSGAWYEAVYTSTREIFDRIKDDPVGVYKMIRGE